jgi:hypothetical protein
MAREACCSVGLGGPYEIATSGLEPGCRHPWHISWLPKGYAPTPDDFIVCLIAEPPGEDWSEYGLSRGLRPPLVEAVCAAIEAAMRGR